MRRTTGQIAGKLNKAEGENKGPDAKPTRTDMDFLSDMVGSEDHELIRRMKDSELTEAEREERMLKENSEDPAFEILSRTSPVAKILGESTYTDELAEQDRIYDQNRENDDLDILNRTSPVEKILGEPTYTHDRAEEDRIYAENREQAEHLAPDDDRSLMDILNGTSPVTHFHL